MIKNKIKTLMLSFPIVSILALPVILVSCNPSDGFSADIEYNGTNSKSITKLVQLGNPSNINASDVGYDFLIEDYIDVLDGQKDWLLNPLKYEFLYSSKFPTRVNYKFLISSYKDLEGNIIKDPINIFISVNGFAE